MSRGPAAPVVCRRESLGSGARCPSTAPSLLTGTNKSAGWVAAAPTGERSRAPGDGGLRRPLVESHETRLWPVALPPFHGCRSEARANRALADARSSSKAGVGRPAPDALAIRRMRHSVRARGATRDCMDSSRRSARRVGGCQVGAGTKRLAVRGLSQMHAVARVYVWMPATDDIDDRRRRPELLDHRQPLLRVHRVARDHEVEHVLHARVVGQLEQFRRAEPGACLSRGVRRCCAAVRAPRQLRTFRRQRARVAVWSPPAAAQPRPASHETSPRPWRWNCRSA